MSRPDQSLAFLRQFLTTQQTPAGETAARALKPSAQTRHGRAPVFLETHGAFVRAAE